MRRLWVALLLSAGGQVWAQSLVTVNISINNPDGSPANGSLTLTASQQFIPVSGAQPVPPTTIPVTITSGSGTVSLYPTSPAIPVGTCYIARWTLNGVAPYTRTWNVPASLTSLTLTQVESDTRCAPQQAAAIALAQLTNSGAAIGQAIVWNGTFWAPGSGGGSGSPGGVNGQIQFNNLGAFGGFTVGGDCVLVRPSLICTKTNGVAFAPSATTDTTNATNITSGTLPTGVIPPINLASSSAGGVTGNLPATQLSGNLAVTNFNGGSGASSSTYWTGNGTWQSIPAINLSASGSGGVTGNLPVTNLNGGLNASASTVWTGNGTWQPFGGTVTHTAGPLTAGAIVIGNAVNDVTVLPSLGTSTTVLHGNATGSPAFSAVVLTSDVSGILPTANGGLATPFFAVTGPASSVKTFTFPNADATVLTTNAFVALNQGGTGADLSAIAKGGVVSGTGAGTVGITTVGTNGQVLSANSAQPGGVQWITIGAGTGTVTSVATTSPITGGTITATGTIGCATCVTSAAALTTNQLLIGAGSQATQVLGSLGTTTTVLHGNSSGIPSFGPVALATDVTAPGSDTQALYNKSGVVGADANYVWNYTAHALSLGGTTYASASIYSNTPGQPASLTIANDTSAAFPAFLNIEGAAGNGGAISGISFRGSLSSPTSTQSGDTLLSLTGYGYRNSTLTQSSYVDITAVSNWTTGNSESQMQFTTTANGSTTPALGMLLNSSQHLLIQTATDTGSGAVLQVAGTYQESITSQPTCDSTHRGVVWFGTTGGIDQYAICTFNGSAYGWRSLI